MRIVRSILTTLGIFLIIMFLCYMLADNPENIENVTFWMCGGLSALLEETLFED